MTTDIAIADIDADIDAAVVDLTVVRTRDNDVVASNQGPITATEARTLINTAIDAANTFYETICELLAREAHKALGYDSPREMVLREFSGSIVNPQTGKPFSDTHIRRMTRAAWLAWSIATTTGLDIADIAVPERVIRDVASQTAGIGDVDLIDTINERITEREARGADEVNDIVAETLTEASGRQPSPKPRQAEHAGVQNDSATPAAGLRPALADPDHTITADTELDTDQGQSAPPDTSSPTPPPVSAASVFATELPDDLDGDLSGLDSTLHDMRTAADVRRVLRDVTAIHQLLPDIAKIAARVPHIIDTVGDDDLADWRTELASTDTAVAFAQKAREVFAEALTEVTLREDEQL